MALRGIRASVVMDSEHLGHGAGLALPTWHLTETHVHARTRTGHVSESALGVMPMPWFWKGVCGPPCTFLCTPVNLYSFQNRS